MRRLRTTLSWRIPRPGTLRGRLALLALVTTAVWVGLLTGAFNLVLSARLGDQADDLLRTRAAAVAATLETRPDGGIVVHEPPDDRALDTGVWIYQGNRAIERPKAPRRLQRQADRLAEHGEIFAESRGPDASRLYALPVLAQPGHGRQIGTVVASVSLDPYHSTARTALAGSAVFGLLLLGVVYLITRGIVGRALRPVAEMSAQAARWSERGAAERFGVADRPDELASLAANLDELLDRLAAVLRHEQQQSAELSHELRTPLARIVAETDWLTARPRDATERRASHVTIASAAATMQRICETLLSEARTRSAPVPGRCALLDLADDLARRCAEEHPQAAQVVVRGSAATAGVAATVAERILAPLLDNARRYAVRTITIECAQVPGGVEVAVADDGPGVPAGVGSAVFDPGRRADPADGHDGAGLGLALARRLARAAGGDIHLAVCAEGARFVVRLPAG
ncbi:HAMP domain-containing sensor histidine kinase [Microtetraspora sp. NBRC 16547]|uniref:ATP-binding protein n=1 Tax=Microtetraspora sp. NBRC 16547 TaxID=3030993 RepID=UPI0024A4D4BF|nr:HAMP domain-containing sensor histidine kinase [Microtetraspora sp. NBRC 16547]GLX02340.1 two-component sensor histidine kinase [Microtetraspora sp. NBRC 16547]